MPSIVIAAHNEEMVIGATLDAVLADVRREDFEIIVSANGCTDLTVAEAERRGVRVLDRPEPGKPGALNAADAVARGFPRIYLDADIVVPVDGVSRVLAMLEGDDPPLAAVPRRQLNTTGRPWAVRAYLAINARLPAFRNGLFGRGFIALSEEGRSRFQGFPAMVADDLYLDSLFTEEEKAEVKEVVVTVEAPFTSRDLLRRLVRVRRGNADMRAASDRGNVEIPVRRSDRWAWLRDVVLPEPRLVSAVLPYLGFTGLAALLARLGPRGPQAWGRDESTRTGRPLKESK